MESHLFEAWQKQLLPPTLHMCTQGRQSESLPDEGAVILGQVERTGETQLIKSLSKCSDGRLCQGLQRLIQDASILPLQKTQKT